ncbi:nonstructural protein [Germiston virus]|uniref:Non-structural protein NS-S n=1 Tax=Bunyavirus germiston TaxID=11574 RepID=NSS_BUNGE|nr:RecName: Full=Non-structural protein NS-S [Germiston virus]AAA87604.1 nonstructural protein [Germiston virus]
MSLITSGVLLTQSQDTLTFSVTTCQGLRLTKFASSTLKDARLKIVSQKEVNGKLRLTLGAGRYLYSIRISLETGTMQCLTTVLPSTVSVDTLPGTYLESTLQRQNQKSS